MKKLVSIFPARHGQSPSPTFYEPVRRPAQHTAARRPARNYNIALSTRTRKPPSGALPLHCPEFSIRVAAIPEKIASSRPHPDTPFRPKRIVSTACAPQSQTGRGEGRSVCRRCGCFAGRSRPATASASGGSRSPAASQPMSPGKVRVNRNQRSARILRLGKKQANVLFSRLIRIFGFAIDTPSRQCSNKFRIFAL